MTVKDFFSVFRNGKYLVRLDLGEEESVNIGEDSTKLIEAFGDVEIKDFYIDDDGRPILIPKTITTIVRQEVKTA